MRSRFKKKIEGVKLLGLREIGLARGFGGYSGGGVRKKTEPLRGYVKKLKAFSLCYGGLVVKAVVFSNPKELESILSLGPQSFK